MEEEGIKRGKGGREKLICPSKRRSPWDKQSYVIETKPFLTWFTRVKKKKKKKKKRNAGGGIKGRF